MKLGFVSAILPDYTMEQLILVASKLRREHGFAGYIHLKTIPEANPWLIEQAGLVKTRVGGAETSERDAAFFVVQPGGTARDVLRLIDLVRSRVQERFGVELELEIRVW